MWNNSKCFSIVGLTERIEDAIKSEYQEIKSKSVTYGELEANIKRYCQAIAFEKSEYLPVVRHTMLSLLSSDTGNLPIR